MKINPKTFLEIFDGVPQAQFSRNILENGFDILSALSQDSGFLKSISEARRSLKENAISVNKLKVSEKYILTSNDLIGNKFILLQRGKKNYFILKFN